LNLHFFFNTRFEQEPVDRVTRQKSCEHGNLHHEPEHGTRFLDLVAEDGAGAPPAGSASAFFVPATGLTTQVMDHRFAKQECKLLK
jgi:hypothetical protein